MRHRRSPRGGDNKRRSRGGAGSCALSCVRYGEHSTRDAERWRNHWPIWLKTGIDGEGC
jgi:hypothetical protein